jgi:hypothetical protein
MMGKHYVKANADDVKRVRPAKISTFRQRDVWIEQLLAFDSEVLSASTKLVAVRIALHLNVDDGRCFPSVPTLAVGTGVGERHIPRVLAALQSSGWLIITRGGGRGRANSFHLTTPAGINPDSGVRVSGTETLTPDAVNPDSGVTPTAKNSERGRGSAPRPLTRAGEGSAVGKQLALVGAGFEDLRAAWPRPWADDEAADRRAFEQARRHASVEDIIAGAAPWAAAMEARYLPVLAKWLAARGWQKPPPKKPKAKPRGNGKVDLGKMMLKEQAGYVEDDDGNVYDPETMGRVQ